MLGAYANSEATWLRAYANSEGPDQPAHPCRLIRAFAVYKQNHWILKNTRWRANALMRLSALQDDVNQHILCILEDTFLLVAAHLNIVG